MAACHEEVISVRRRLVEVERERDEARAELERWQHGYYPGPDAEEHLERIAELETELGEARLALRLLNQSTVVRSMLKGSHDPQVTNAIDAAMGGERTSDDD